MYCNHLKLKSWCRKNCRQASNIKIITGHTFLCRAKKGLKFTLFFTFFFYKFDYLHRYWYLAGFSFMNELPQLSQIHPKFISQRWWWADLSTENHNKAKGKICHQTNWQRQNPKNWKRTGKKSKETNILLVNQ